MPFLTITLILIIAEIIKQIKAFNVGYNLWSIPLHFCSMFMVWFALASLTKGKTSKIGHKIAFTTGIAFLITFILDPTSIIGGATENLSFSFANFNSLHTFYYHFGVILFLFLQATIKIELPTLKDLKVIALPFFSWMAITAVIANLINTNFSNLLFNNVVFMDNIRLNLGYPLYLISMFTLFFALCFVILAFSTLLEYIKKRAVIDSPALFFFSYLITFL